MRAPNGSNVWSQLGAKWTIFSAFLALMVSPVASAAGRVAREQPVDAGQWGALSQLGDNSIAGNFQQSASVVNCGDACGNRCWRLPKRMLLARLCVGPE